MLSQWMEERPWAYRSFALASFRRKAHRRHPYCQWCGGHLPRSRDATVDHVVPTSRGGSDDYGNLVLSCLPCNNQKGDALIPRKPLGPNWEEEWGIARAAVETASPPVSVVPSTGRYVLWVKWKDSRRPGWARACVKHSEKSCRGHLAQFSSPLLEASLILPEGEVPEGELMAPLEIA